MGKVWITTSSTTIESMVNSINAACDQNFIPEHLFFLKNPGVESEVDEAISIARTVVEAYSGEPPEITITELDHEREFHKIRAHVQEAIEEAAQADDEVAVDFTPGRKFMSAIAFAAGMRYDADHVFYFYVSSREYKGQLYPEIPRSAVDLIDFTEVV